MAADQESIYFDAARIIAKGGIIAFRTDTFYGLGADPFNLKALRGIRKLKGREEGKPLLLVISDVLQVRRFILSPSRSFEEVSRRYWPGPLTIVDKARPELPMELTAGSGTIGLRLPDDQRVCDLVRVCGGALTATSANLSGSLPARSAAEVQTYFPSGIDLMVDEGYVTTDQPSTVLDLSGPKPRVVREGAIPLENLRQILGELK